jgi:hypothetical protein
MPPTNMHCEITTYSDSESGMHYAEDYSIWSGRRIFWDIKKI